MPSLSYKFTSSVLEDGTTILRPLVPVNLQFGNGRKLNTLMLVDSGADYSMIDRELAQQLGVDPIRMGKTSGSSGEADVEISKLHAELVYGNRTFPFEMPVQVPLEKGFPVIPLLGREPFFWLFDVNFRMGYTETKGKFVIIPVRKRRRARDYR